MKLRLALSLIIAVCALLPARAQETAAMVGQLKTLGARADGVHDDTAAIQKAIDRVHNDGGGTVIFPPGAYRITGAGLKLRSKVTLKGMDVFSSVLSFDQTDPAQYAVNLTNDVGEYAPQWSSIRELKIFTRGGGAIRDTPLPAKDDGPVTGWLYGSIRDVVIEGGARGDYAIKLSNYSQGVLLENVHFNAFLGPAVYINGNANVLRRVCPDNFAGWYADRHYENPKCLAMVSIAGDGNTLEESTIEAFSGCPALKLTGYRHSVSRLWAEADGPIPGAAWIVLDDAHHVLFDWPHLLNPATQKLVLRNGSDATILLLEPKHIDPANGSLDVDKTSSLTVMVPERSMTPGVHVITRPQDGLQLPDDSEPQP